MEASHLHTCILTLVRADSLVPRTPRASARTVMLLIRTAQTAMMLQRTRATVPYMVRMRLPSSMPFCEGTVDLWSDPRKNG